MVTFAVQLSLPICSLGSKPRGRTRLSQSCPPRLRHLHSRQPAFVWSVRCRFLAPQVPSAPLVPLPRFELPRHQGQMVAGQETDINKQAKGHMTKLLTRMLDPGTTIELSCF